jgi:iron complex transport system ATP-binding protein
MSATGNSQQAARLGVYGLSHSYGRREVLKEVSFELAAGEILSLLGPNGSGKSTLLKAIAGVLPGESGFARSRHPKVLYQGKDFLSQPLSWRAQRVAYVGADLNAQFPMTAEQAVLLGRSSQGASLFRLSTPDDRAAVEQAMRHCSCWELRRRDLHSLSGGERQLVALARALAQSARTLFLDETLSRMDLHHQAAVGRLLTQLASIGYSIVLVSHDVNIASEWAHSALLLRKGERVACGPIREVLTDASIRALYPDSELTVAASPASGAPKVFFGRRA